MIQLQRHIEILLLSHDCVIVPGFGGFIAHHVDARYDDDDRLWLPPYRTLGFNAQLTLNDSLLVQSYVEAYDMSYPDALRQIEAEVEELKGILNSEGEYSMEALGTIRVNVEGSYEFEPCEAGILSPEEYGLSDFSFKRLVDARGDRPVANEKPVATVAESTDATEVQVGEEPSPTLLEFTSDEDEADDNRALVIKMSWVRNAVAVAAAIACFFLLATPVANSDLGNQAMSHLQSNILYKLLPKDSNMMPAQPVAAKVKEENTAVQPEQKVEPTAEAKAEVITEIKTDEKLVAKTEENKINVEAPTAKTEHQKTIYCIVLASQVKRTNAEFFVNRLKQQGIADARIYINNGVVRVICGAFENQSQAYNQLNKMNDQEEFEEAWVYKMKEV